jgi:RimJ/RimL family protein N-acetyltransferase
MIRPFVNDDLETIHDVLSAAWEEPEFERIASIENRKRWLHWAVQNEMMLAEQFMPPYGDRAIVLRGENVLVGSVGVVPSVGPFGQLPGFPAHQGSRRWFPEFGLYWAVDPAYQGLGIATEAARGLIEKMSEQFHIGRIIAMTRFENERSQAVMRKLGMQILRNPEPEPAWFQIVGLLEID